MDIAATGLRSWERIFEEFSDRATIEQAAVDRRGADAHEHRVASLEDLAVDTDARGREVAIAADNPSQVRRRWRRSCAPFRMPQSTRPPVIPL